MEGGFTNEVASSGGIRFFKNVMGMWIQQECVRHWEEEELDEGTLQCTNYRGYIDHADARFLKPNTYDNLMTDRIDAWCGEHNLPKPSSNGEYMVAIYRGLAKAIGDWKEI